MRSRDTFSIFRWGFDRKMYIIPWKIRLNFVLKVIWGYYEIIKNNDKPDLVRTQKTTETYKRR